MVLTFSYFVVPEIFKNWNFICFFENSYLQYCGDLTESRLESTVRSGCKNCKNCKSCKNYGGFQEAACVL
jgi:hypothetical protein